MKSIFSLDNPFFQFLSKIGDLVQANVLFLICSIPIVTIGASTAAMYKVTQDIAGNTEAGIFKTFFRAFKENFKQATAVWLIMLVLLIGTGCNLLLINSYFSGTAAFALKCVLGAIAVFLLCICAYLFPLMVRYRNTLPAHLRNAVILAIAKLPRTLLMILLNTLPFWIMYFSMMTFLKTLIFWVVIGFGLLNYCDSFLLIPVFRELETGDQAEGRT